MGQFPVLISLLTDRIWYYFIEAVENSFCLKAVFVFVFFLNFDSLREKKLWRKKTTCTDEGNDKRLLGDPSLCKFYAQNM